MPRAKLRVAAPKPKARAKLRPAAIDKARTNAMALIARRRDRDAVNAFLDKAHRLLTRHWAKADWAARAKLIESAAWLIRVAAASPQRAAARKAPGVKRRRQSSLVTGVPD